MALNYRFTHVPNTEKALRFRVNGPEKGSEAYFDFSRKLINIWGNPKEEDLHQLMIAYVRKHGWAKEAVSMTVDNSPKNLINYTHSISKSKK